MGFHRGPNIITDGLILNLDAANSRSFRGQQTTNLMTGDKPKFLSPTWRTGSGNIDGTVTEGYEIPGVTEKLGVWVNVPSAPSGDTNPVYWGFAAVNGTGQTYSGQAWIYNNGINNFYISFSNGCTSTKNSGTIYPGDIKKIDLKGFTSIYPINHRFTILRYDKEDEINFVGYQMQVETGSTTTPFVYDYRGLTYSSGGGWIDTSNSRNHCYFVDSLFSYSGESSGYLSFFSPTSGATLSKDLTVTWGNPWTLEFYARFTNTALIAMGDINTNIYVLTSSDILYFAVLPSAYLFVSDMNDYYDKWTHYIITTTGNGYYDTYVNSNIEYQNTQFTGSNFDFSLTTIGSGRPTGLGSAEGDIANVKVYDRYFTQEDVTNNYHVLKGRFE